MYLQSTGALLSMSLLAGGVVLALGSTGAEANTIFVDQQTGGTQDGTASHPFKTVTQALGVARPGDTILLRTGLYDVQSQSLLIDHATTIRADGGPAIVEVSKPIPPPPPAPKIVSFNAAPDDGYIY